MRVAVTWPDPEIATKDLLKALISPYEPTVTVAIGVPKNWKPTSPAHLQVRWDGTPTDVPMVALYPVMSIIARAASPSEAKRLALLARGLLGGPLDSDDITCAVPLTGPLQARDPETNAELASFTVRVTIRSTTLTGS